MRRLAVPAGILVLALAGVLAAAAFFSSRDDATLGREDGPGRARSGPVPRVAAGNVLLLYADPGLRPALRALAEDIAGPPDPVLAAAGQAVLVRRADETAASVQALTARRFLDADGPDDPALRAFVEYWLGRDPG